MSPKVPEEHKEQRRLDIIQAAIAVFRRKGYEATSMQDIIEETRMSRGGVYLYFSGKEDLFRALLDQIDAEHKKGYTQLIEHTKSAWEAVEYLLNLQIKETEDIADSLAPVIYEFFMTGWREKARHDYLVSRYQYATNELTSFLKIGIERGEFTPLLPIETIAQYVISFLDGMSIDAFFIGSERVDVKAQIEALRMFLRHVLQVK